MLQRTIQAQYGLGRLHTCLALVPKPVHWL